MTIYNDDPERDAQFDELETEETYDDVMSSETTYDAETIEDLDQGELSEDLDETWESPDEAEAEPDVAKARKKSPVALYVIIALVVLAGTGFVVLKMSSSGTDIAQEQAEITEVGSLQGLRPEGEQISVTSETVVPVEAPQPPPQPQGFMNEVPTNKPALTAIPAEGTAPGGAGPAVVVPQTSPAVPVISSADTPTPSQETPPALSQVEPAQPPVVLGGLKPVSDFPTVDQIKKAPYADHVQMAPDNAQQATVQAVNAPSSNDNSPQLAVVQSRLDAALARVSALEKDLDAARRAEKVALEKASSLSNANNSVQTSQADAAQKAAQARIRELEDQVNALQKRASGQPADVASASAPALSQATDTKASLPQSSVKEADPIIRPKPVTSAAPKPVAWELRSAQPGQAMLSRKNSSDIRNVSVGESVPGLGRITAIESTPSGWVVRGTAGQVRQ